MAAKKNTAYEVRSVNTGAVVCGPYSKKKDAEREVSRLNGEAASGLGAPTEDFPDGQPLGNNTGGAVLHDGQLQRYELVTSEGVVL